MKAWGGLAVAVALVLMLAGGESGPAGGGAEGQELKGAVHHINYDDPEVIQGSLQAPDILPVTVRGKAFHENLIQYRANFNDKVLRSVKAL